ncbi:MAG TPA: ACT domain-containing protein [Nocardioidaceae bacterium]|nr:ACT domain-containing protein [Nocardioidaceae bacterium]
MTHTLLQHDEPLAVVRLGPGADIPDWAVSGTLLSVTATADETSLVCNHAGVPRKSRHEGPFTAFSVDGPLDFTLTGVLSALLGPLAEREIPVFTVSTFDTDWILVPADQAEQAAEQWRGSGHEVQSANQPTDPSSREGTK